MKYNSYANPFLSRKTYNTICEWWIRSTFNGQIPLFKMAHSNVPTGKFHAKAVSQYMFNRKAEGDIRLSNNFVTIETPDDVSMINVDDIVRFQGLFYRVENVSKREITKTRENMRKPLCVFVLQLAR